AGLTAPFWGHLADRRRLHRQVLLAGMLAALVALLFMPTELGLPLKTMFAAVLGVGFAAANTVANMFIVEVRPPNEWDDRIGALQALSRASLFRRPQLFDLARLVPARRCLYWVQLTARRSKALLWMGVGRVVMVKGM